MFQNVSSIVIRYSICHYDLSYDQAALRTLLSAPLSVRPSGCATFFLMLLFIRISGIITIDKDDVQAKGWGHRSKVKFTEVKSKLAPMWALPDCNSSLNSHIPTKWYTKLSKCHDEVPYCFARSFVKFQGHPEATDFDPNWAFQDCNFSLNLHMATEWYKKLKVA